MAFTKEISHLTNILSEYYKDHYENPDVKVREIKHILKELNAECFKELMKNIYKELNKFGKTSWDDPLNEGEILVLVQVIEIFLKLK